MLFSNIWVSLLLRVLLVRLMSGFCLFHSLVFSWLLVFILSVSQFSNVLLCLLLGGNFSRMEKVRWFLVLMISILLLILFFFAIHALLTMVVVRLAMRLQSVVSIFCLRIFQILVLS